MKLAEVVLLNMVVKLRTETGPTITRPSERSLEFLEGNFSTERLSYTEPTQKSVVFPTHSMKYLRGIEE